MRRATFPLIKLDDRASDGRLINAVAIDPGLFPAKVIRAPDDPLRDRFDAGMIEFVTFCDGWVMGHGALHDDLALRMFSDGDDLYVEADTDVDRLAVPDDGRPFVTPQPIDLSVTLLGATIGTNPLWDGCKVVLG